MENIENRLKAIEEKVDKVFVSAEKTRKYFLWILILTVVAFVLPLIGMLFAIPKFLETYSSVAGLGL